MGSFLMKSAAGCGLVLILMLSQVVSGQRFVNLVPSDVAACPTTEIFQSRITRPGCLWECYNFLDAKIFLYEKIVEGQNCPGSGHNFVDRVSSLLINGEHTVCQQQNVFGDDYYAEDYMCISSKAVMIIINEIMVACEGVDRNDLPQPILRTNALSCAPEQTFPRETFNTVDPDIVDGAAEQPPTSDIWSVITGGTEEAREQLYEYFKDHAVRLQKRHDFVIWRADTLLDKAHTLHRQARRSRHDWELRNLLYVMAQMYYNRINHNYNLADEIWYELWDLEDKKSSLEYYAPFLNGSNGNYYYSYYYYYYGGYSGYVYTYSNNNYSRKSRYGYVSYREAMDTPETPELIAARQQVEEVERGGLTCISSSANCNNHYWKTNVKVNDECYSVCVSKQCKYDFTFLYCFFVTIYTGYTNPTCHANVATRKLCFEERPNYDRD